MDMFRTLHFKFVVPISAALCHATLMPGCLDPHDLLLVGHDPGHPAAETSNPVATNYPAPFINEIHYDNSGSDRGEAIEILAPAQLALDGYQVILYNGANGAVYHRAKLQGKVDDSGNGWGARVLDFPRNGIQNGGPDGLALVDPKSKVLEFWSYEGSFVATDGPAAGQRSVDMGVRETASTPVGYSLQKIGEGATGSDFQWAGPQPASFGRINEGQRLSAITPGDSGPGSDGAPGSGSGGDAGVDCPVASHPIHQIQGSGATSALENQSASVQGVVTASFYGEKALGGVFIQSITPDNDPSTSEGIFVYAPALESAKALKIGDRVWLEGTVKEFYGLTQIADLRDLKNCGRAALPAPQSLQFPWDSTRAESLEGMRVRLDQARVSDLYNWGKYGEVLVSQPERLWQQSNRNDISSDLGPSHSVLIDDGFTATYPLARPYDDTGLRSGDRIEGLEGVLSFGFGAYRIQPTHLGKVIHDNPRPEAPPRRGNLRISSLNLHNYFLTLGERGAAHASAAKRQETKLVAAITALDADILALQELENNRDVLPALAAAVNAQLSDPAKHYRAVDASYPVGSDAIAVGLLYRPAQVSTQGAATIDHDSAHRRPLIAQSFRLQNQGQPLTVLSGHFKSKGCSGASGANADQNDGQGCYNQERRNQAEAAQRFIQTLQDQHGGAIYLLGDLNAYSEEDPIRDLRNAGLTDLAQRDIALDDRYSYVYYGRAGLLDHAFANQLGADYVKQSTIWHINADESFALDYGAKSAKAPLSFRPDAFRSSDHDPFILDLQIDQANRP